MQPFEIGKKLLLNGDYEKAFYNLALTYGQQKKSKQAKDIYSKLLKLNPNYMNVYVNLALEYIATNEDNKALFLYKKALKNLRRWANVMTPAWRQWAPPWNFTI